MPCILGVGTIHHMALQSHLKTHAFCPSGPTVLPAPLCCPHCGLSVHISTASPTSTRLAPPARLGNCACCLHWPHALPLLCSCCLQRTTTCSALPAPPDFPDRPPQHPTHGAPTAPAPAPPAPARPRISTPCAPSCSPCVPGPHCWAGSSPCPAVPGLRATARGVSRQGWCAGGAQGGGGQHACMEGVAVGLIVCQHPSLSHMNQHTFSA